MNQRRGLGDAPLHWIGAQEPALGTGDIRSLDMTAIDESDRFRLRHPPYPKLDELMAQIKEYGQTTPVFVRPKKGEGRFELISGYRRCAALQKLGAPRILARVFADVSDATAYDLAISENQDRDDLTDLERSEVCLRLQDEGKTVQQIATRMGWQSERQVYNYLRIAKGASPLLRQAFQARQISYVVGLLLVEQMSDELLSAGVEDEILRTIVENQMSVREVRAYLARVKSRLANGSSLDDATVPERGGEYVREHKNGAFSLHAKFDPRQPDELRAAIEALQNALKRAKSMMQWLEKETDVVSASEMVSTKN